MPGFLGQLGMQAAGSAIGAGMGLALQGSQDSRQIKQQQKLQDMQIAGQKQMGIFNREQQMQLWNDTNYAAQIEQMKKAKLSPGLIYGQGGPGGTTNAQTGSVSGADAPKGGGEAMGMGIQMGQAAMIAAQIKLMEAQTNKTNVEASKIGGVDTTLGETQIKSILQGIDNQKAQKALTEAQEYATNVVSDINARSSNGQVAMILKNLERETEEVRKIMRENGINDQTIQEKIDQIKYESLQAGLNNLMTEQGITESQAKIAKMIQDVAQGWEALSLQERNTKVQEKLLEISGGKLNLEKQQTLIRLIENMFNRLMPSASTVISQLKPAL